MWWFRKIKTSPIAFALYFILFFIVGNGLIEFYHWSVQEEHELNVQRAAQANQYLNSLLLAFHDLDIGFRGYSLVPNEQLLSPFKIGEGNYKLNLAQLEEVVSSMGIDTRNIGVVEQKFEDYVALLKKMMSWRDTGNIAAFESALMEDPGYDLWMVYNSFTKELTAAQNEVLLQSSEKLERADLISTTMRFALLLLGLPTLILTILQLKRDQKRRISLFQELDKNNKEYLFDPLEKEGETDKDEKKVTEALISNMRKATDFISNIAGGNFEMQWEGLNEQNKEANRKNLAGELMLMREQMLKVKKEDQIRLWTTEGISRFAEIVRQHQDDMALLADKITTNVVKYLGANQASLFFVEEREGQEVVLEQKSCYAYNRKKFLEKIVKPGEGLVGQTYLEKEIIYLTDIPQNYVRITSGLGEATPSSLILVPLRFNDRVEGVLEIASFKKIESHEIEFLEKIGEIIASSIVTIHSSVEMKKMVEEMKYKSEEMKAQEEEMRQNMEELQATQEEMMRKTREYQGIIEDRERELELQLVENKMLQKKLQSS